MKTRFTLVDVLAEVRDLRHIALDMRLINIFDVDSKTYLLKLADHDRKVILLIESGVRVHTTKYARDKPVQPSGFVMKLRKHLRNKRLTGVSQVGVDRVVDFMFGSGPAAHHLIVELYDRGNVVLTDADYTILALLRGYTLEVGGSGKAGTEGAQALEDEGEVGKQVQCKPADGPVKAPEGEAGAGGDRVRIAVKQRYAFATDSSRLVRSAAMGPLLVEGEARGEVGDGVEQAEAEGSGPTNDAFMDATWPASRLSLSLEAYLSEYERTVVVGMPGKARKKLTLASCLVAKGSGLDVYGPALVEHALALAALGTGAKLEAVKSSGGGPGGVCAYDGQILGRLAEALRELPALVRRISAERGPAYGILEPLPTAAPIPQTGLDTLLTGLQLGGADGGVPCPMPNPPPSVAGVVHFALPPMGGCLGGWADVQARVQEHIVAARGGGRDEVSVGGAAVVDAEPGTGGGVKVEEEGLGAGQLPPALPFRLVDFSAALLAQYSIPPAKGVGGGQGVPATYVTFPDFDAAVDEYFSRLDVAKAEKAEAQARSAAAKRLDRIRESHMASLSGLAATQTASYRRGRVLEEHAVVVDAACLVVRSALEHGVRWTDLQRLVEAESASGNPVARLIVPHRMDLANGRITLCLVDGQEAWEAREGRAQARREERRRVRGGGGGSEDEDDEDGEDEDEDEDEDENGEGEDEVEGGDHAGTVAPIGKGDGKENGPKGKAGKGKYSTQGKGGAEGGVGGKEGRRSRAKERGKGDADEKLAARLGGKHALLVDVSVLESAAANAGLYYSAGKGAREKEGRTLAAATVAMKVAEKKVAAASAKEVAAAAAVRSIRIARKPHWWERFHWFITSEGLVAVAGKSAQDNEALVKRYLRPQDAYVHADVHGAASVILRHTSPDPAAGPTLPALSLSQAGHFCVCLSSAWEANAPTSAWWVYASQVSKTAPTGEYLGTGSFMVRGKKNLLPPVRLELGMALLFKVDEACVDRHIGDRRVRGEGEGGTRSKAAIPAPAPDAEAPHVPPCDTEGVVDGSSPPADAAAAGTVTGAAGRIPSHVRKNAKKLERTRGLSPGSALTAALAVEGARGEGEASVPAPAPVPDTAPSPTVPPPSAPKRGQKGKARRVKERYGEQDEEDRALALAALGHKEGGKAEAVPVPTYPPASGGKGGKAAKGSHPKGEEGTGGGGGVPKTLEGPKTEAEEEEDEDGKMGGGEEESRALASLVSWPAHDDILTHAVPMLCPYAVALASKYRVKITPGGMKKGKAGGAVLATWTGAAKGASFGTERERELLRTLGDTEMVAVLLSGCRVSAAPAPS